MKTMNMTDMERLEKLAALAETGVTLKHEEFTYLMDTIRVLREALLMVEWVWMSSSGWSQDSKQCPWCRQNNDMVGHALDCPRQRALGKA